MSTQQTVLVFGAFDGLHDGHKFFLGKARKLGERLVAVIAQDAVVERLKKHPPVFSLAKRIETVRESGLIDEATVGDMQLGNWSAVKAYKPETIALGYDQAELEQELREYIKKENLPITLVRLPAHLPEKFHSSMLN